MKRILLIIITTLFGILFLLPKYSFAIEDPLAIPNNKMGVHILFPDELAQASKLVNSNGDWGYVTIPIQSGDKDLEKWQKFMDSAKQNHVIPIIRLATEGDYFNTSVWRKPTHEDVLDFANFLNSLSWPVKNRYIVVFNEVNRSDEWEGNFSPKEYAEILKFTAETFKSLNPDYFIISSGLDNAAPNVPGKYMDQYDFMNAMHKAVPGIYNFVDGLGSHSYPNPGFRQMPHILTSQSISSFNFEKDLAYRLCGKKLPVFITETGWSKDALPENKIAEYFKYAFQYVWSDKSIVAITPFLLQSGAPFSQFSLMNGNEDHNEIFKTLLGIAKAVGKPTVSFAENSLTLQTDSASKILPVKTFPKKTQYKTLPMEKTDAIEDFFKWLLKL